MIYDASNHLDKERASELIDFLFRKEKIFELKEVRKKRSVSQNSYLHLILTWFALEYGETLDYTKQVIFKQWVNNEIFYKEYVNLKTGEIRDSWKSTSELNTRDLTTAIDRFRNYSSREAGIYLPEPGDLASINRMELQIRRSNTNHL